MITALQSEGKMTILLGSTELVSCEVHWAMYINTINQKCIRQLAAGVLGQTLYESGPFVGATRALWLENLKLFLIWSFSK